MKHDGADHFDTSDVREVVRNARPDQIMRLLREIGRLPEGGPRTARTPDEQA
jgi:hypothetical protein